jgi:hypothetical protein
MEKFVVSNRSSRYLLAAREQGIIPWDWIVEEGRQFERAEVFENPEEFRRIVSQAYRRDCWCMQPHRVQVWSEKSTVYGVLQSILNQYAVPFLNCKGFASATRARAIAEDNDGRPVIALYIGDRDPSGMYMSEVDWPNRMEKYGGSHVEFRRIALLPDQVGGLPSFPASDKVKDNSYEWFVENYGELCWELDAMDPNNLRAIVENEVVKLIDPKKWKRCEPQGEEGIADCLGCIAENPEGAALSRAALPQQED